MSNHSAGVYRRRRVFILVFGLLLLIIAVSLCLLLTRGDDQQLDAQVADIQPEPATQAEVTPNTPQVEVTPNTPQDSAAKIGDPTAGALTPQTATEPFTRDGVIVVNKKHPLPESYNPGENPEAVAALKKLIQSGKAAGLDLIDSWSGFRSYTYQSTLFNNYSASSGVTAAETYSARPGYSEHQTGLAFDLKDSTQNLYRIDDPTYKFDTDWVAQHCSDFGFILRYRDEWQSETGYVGEPWHLRYLGVELAKKVATSGKTLEAYLGVEGGDYRR
ncbi:MAG: M15 family metallopeptidase [Candidatus Ancillula sp.]|jgi:LAS superfamily LD-carboxypeptidase LdcB|nr:M15 family metallopeptidase [Candidatus Ancillula sp.]